MNFPSTDGVDVCAINTPDFRYGGLVIIAFSRISSVCTPLESTLGVRDTLDDLPPLRKIFDMSELVELLRTEEKIQNFLKMHLIDCFTHGNNLLYPVHAYLRLFEKIVFETPLFTSELSICF